MKIIAYTLDNLPGAADAVETARFETPRFKYWRNSKQTQIILLYNDVY